MSIQFSEEKQEEKLKKLRVQQEESEAQRRAEKYGLPYLDLFAKPIDQEILSSIDEISAKKAEMATIQKTQTSLVVAVYDPSNPETKIILENLKKQNKEVQIFVVSMRSLNKIFELYKFIGDQKEITGSVEISSENILIIQSKITNIDTAKNIFKDQETYKSTTSLLEVIIGGSLALGASDIHIEAEEKNAKLRYRIDGILQDIASFTLKIYKSLLMRVKLISRLKLNIADMPQDGRFTIKLDNIEVETRVSILPGSYGEGIVMRILHPKSISVPLDQLGFSNYHYDIIEKEIKRPNGMIIVTGPTGSGKTTTLYAFIKKLNSPEIKIITIEDPVEYHIEGLSQTQIMPDKGLTFASALRSILRQDPDMILVGELRDNETVETALHAALTGHLVFSTLHTNDAAGAIPRLIDVGANVAIIAPALNLIIAQRLVRKACSKCSIFELPTKEEKENLQKNLENIPKSARKEAPEIDDNLKIKRIKECEFCNHTGYKGRIGIHEILIINEKMKELILKSPSQFEILALAKKQGMLTMKEDGFLKVLKGMTTIEEVESTVG